MDYLSTLSLYGSGLSSQSHASQAALFSAVLGILFHLTIARRIEMEYYMYQLLALLLFAAITVTSAYLLMGVSVFHTIARICIIAGCFSVGTFASMISYRLFFHRLRKFPGPLDSKVSRFFSALRAAKEVKYYKEIAKLNEQYGDFVRTGPREICIVRASAVQAIYGPTSKCRKSTWYTQSSTDHDRASIHMSRDPEKHKQRRKAWDRGFAVKALRTYEPRIKVLVDQLITQFSKQKGAVDATAWSMYLSFDVMGEVGLGQDFGSVSSGTEHSAIKAIHDHLLILGIGSHMPWLLNLASRIPGATAGYAEFFNYCETQVNAKKRNLDLSKYPQDVLSWLLKAVVEKDISASPTAESLNDDARLLIIAGSETSATTLAQILFYLAKFPAVFKKLQERVDAVMPSPADWTYEKTKSIAYVDNIIDEGLRLKPAILSNLYRVTPPQGIQVDEQHIPGDTNVFVPMQRIQTDPRYWKEAAEFVPERFGERRVEMGTDDSPFMPFSLGVYSCPGKSMAIMTMRIALSRIAQEFDISFAPGETGEKFDKEAGDVVTTSLLPLMLQFTPRK
ncbi:putative benzoate 4-monooxygenase cytochrome P450 [Hypoxylon rubiginosum]|uniref:Benzoate 4-monooxygenase cytochrome P450 n=1 Tax=Hypoxylon rubiginosum TaxID=110542 RepID=A0ACB9YT47_9PEZI|nr:putative benzoate 4-monooxygenase cytochrome P450 [Hypoxylon rubiginosum]